VLRRGVGSGSGLSGGNGGVSCRLGLGGSGRESPGPRLPQAFRAQARSAWSRRGARKRAAVRAGGNVGAAAACGSAAGDDRYGAGIGVPATETYRPGYPGF